MMMLKYQPTFVFVLLLLVRADLAFQHACRIRDLVLLA